MLSTNVKISANKVSIEMNWLNKTVWVRKDAVLNAALKKLANYAYYAPELFKQLVELYDRILINEHQGNHHLNTTIYLEIRVLLSDFRHAVLQKVNNEYVSILCTDVGDQLMVHLTS